MPPLCRETQSLGQQMLKEPLGINGLISAGPYFAASGRYTNNHISRSVRPTCHSILDHWQHNWLQLIKIKRWPAELQAGHQPFQRWKKENWKSIRIKTAKGVRLNGSVQLWCCMLLLVHGPRADFRCRGVIRPESSPHVFLLPKTLNLKKKSDGHLSVVAFGSEGPLSENIYSF